MNLLALRAGGRRISQIAQWISVGMFIGMFVLFVVSVIQRYVLVRPVNWVDESILILFLWSTFLTEALVLREREQVTFDVIWDLAGPGLRRAIGATRADIRNQFLLESVMICFVGGIIGVVLGVVLAFSVGAFFELEVAFAWEATVVSFVLSVAIGVVFGLWPAMKAASIHPVEALQHA